MGTELPPKVGSPTHDDRLLPSILLRGMDEGIKTRNELSEAEAEERRLQAALGLATARVEVLRARFEENRKFTLDVWDTLKVEFSRPHDHDMEDRDDG